MERCFSSAIHTDINATFAYLMASNTTYDSLNVSWDHDFKFCKDFSVFMDGRHVANKPSRSTSYYIDNLQPNTTYHMTVVAMEPGMSNVTVSNTFTTGKYMREQMLEHLPFYLCICTHKYSSCTCTCRSIATTVTIAIIATTTATTDTFLPYYS